MTFVDYLTHMQKTLDENPELAGLDVELTEEGGILFTPPEIIVYPNSAKVVLGRHTDDLGNALMGLILERN